MTRNSLVNTPNGGSPAIAATPAIRPQPSTGWRDRQAAHLGDALRALHLRHVADREEDRRLGQAVHGHLQQAGEVGQRAAHAEGEHR